MRVLNRGSDRGQRAGCRARVQTLKGSPSPEGLKGQAGNASLKVDDVASISHFIHWVDEGSIY